MHAHPTARTQPTSDPPTSRARSAAHGGAAQADPSRPSTPPELRVDAPGWWERFWAGQPGRRDHD